MSRVFKCDRCGEIFKENDGAERMVEDAEEEWDEVEERMRKPYINPNAVSNHIQTIQNLRCDADLTDEQVQKIIRIGDRYWEMVGKFKEEDMTPDEFADYITAKSEQVEKELRERWS